MFLIFYHLIVLLTGYQGYACTDDTHALPVSLQLASAYLLTMSNLFFIPAIAFATRRGFIVEAFVYFYTMFFSTVRPKIHLIDWNIIVVVHKGMKFDSNQAQHELPQTALGTKNKGELRPFSWYQGLYVLTEWPNVYLINVKFSQTVSFLGDLMPRNIHTQ